MSIRNLISQDTEIIQDEVSQDGKVYRFEGKPDGNLLAEAFLATKDQVNVYARHWTTICGSLVKPEMVKYIILVHMTLLPEEGEEAYDITEIALLCSKQGPLFMKMVGAATKCLGIKEEKEDNNNPDPNSLFDKTASGN